MNKVYMVYEEYYDNECDNEGFSTNVTICSTKNKAENILKEIKNREIQESWVGGFIKNNPELDIFEGEIIDTDNSFIVYDYYGARHICITIEEKEVK